MGIFHIAGAAVTFALFLYLFFAMLKPEEFS